MGGAFRRYQATIFLPEPAASAVDEVRRRWDPVMAARIAPHVTVARDARADEVAAVARRVAPFRLRMGGAARWPPPEAGIYVDVDDVDGGLAALGGAGLGHPHVTLLHPRTTGEDARRRAWAQLVGWRVDADVAVEAVSVVGDTGTGWVEVARFGLGRGGRE